MRTPVSRIEKTAGLFIILALLVFLAVLILPNVMAGRFLAFHQLQVSARDGIGLKVGDKVVMQGIQIGEVSDLRLDETNKVLIRCKIYPAFRDKLVAGTLIYLIPPDLFGSPMIRLVPGAGEPLDPQAFIEAQMETSITDKIGELSGDFRRVFDKVEDRIEQVGENLTALNKVLVAVNEGQGLVGRILHDKDLAERVRQIVARVDETVSGLERIRARMEEFAGVLPALKEDLADSSSKLRSSLAQAEESLKEIDRMLPALGENLVDSSAKLRSSLAQIEKGLERFPDIAADAAFSLDDARRVLESLKRKFLISGNLPAEPEARSTTSAGYRASTVRQEPASKPQGAPGPKEAP